MVYDLYRAIELLFQKEIKQNREYIKRMENKNLSAFIIGKLEVIQNENNEK